MPYTLGQAAKATGKQKSTILDSIRKGRISAVKNDLGRYAIDPSELHRVYPPNAHNVQLERKETPSNHYQNTLLEEKIKFLEREITRLERMETDLREDRDHWREEATQIRRMLTDQNSTTTAAKAESGFWKRLFRGI